MTPHDCGARTSLGEVNPRSRAQRHRDRHRRPLLCWGAVFFQGPPDLEVEEQFVDDSEEQLRKKSTNSMWRKWYF